MDLDQIIRGRITVLIADNKRAELIALLEEQGVLQPVKIADKLIEAYRYMDQYDIARHKALTKAQTSGKARDKLEFEGADLAYQALVYSWAKVVEDLLCPEQSIANFASNKANLLSLINQPFHEDEEVRQQTVEIIKNSILKDYYAQIEDTERRDKESAIYDLESEGSSVINEIEELIHRISYKELPQYADLILKDDLEKLDDKFEMMASLFRQAIRMIRDEIGNQEKTGGV